MMQTLKSEKSAYIALELVSATRLDAKTRTLATLLELFHAKTIFLRLPGSFTLEVICRLSDKDYLIELYQYFDQQIDLWFKESKKHNAKLHRLSFYQGLEVGLREKLVDKFHADTVNASAPSKDLILANEKMLEQHFELLYPRTGFTRAKGLQDRKSFAQGKLQGTRIELKNKLTRTHNLLDFFN